MRQVNDNLRARNHPLRIVCIERVLVATSDLGAACDRWRRAGFSAARLDNRIDGMSFARIATGAVAIDLCAITGAAVPALAARVAEATGLGGGIIGWVWGVARGSTPPQAPATFALPAATGGMVAAAVIKSGLPNVWTAAVEIDASMAERESRLAASCGPNPNTVEYLEHIVVMTPVLDDAIAAHEALGVPCKRIRDAGGGARQAFFKLERTVIEVVGPARGRPGCWGLALMCSDIRAAVACARSNGLEATEPKAAIQGGLIARIVSPLDGVAIAFMQR
jgi:predicted enzyme related to lactoylglutathione lyase